MLLISPQELTNFRDETNMLFEIMVMYAKQQEKDTVLKAKENSAVLAHLKNLRDVIGICDRLYIDHYVKIQYMSFMLWSVDRTYLIKSLHSLIL